MSNAYNKVKEAIGFWEEGQKSFEKASSVLSGGPASFYYKRLEGYVDALFNRFAPFKEGDRVTITKKPNTDNNWNNCKHFLTKGALGTVMGVDYRDNHFSADVVFDKETWIDGAGIEQPVTQKHTFHMWENQIQRIDQEQLGCGSP